MSDHPEAAPPRLSEEAIIGYRQLLADKDFETRFPTQHAELRRTVLEALAATGQNLEPTPDGRSPAQALIDRQFGVSFTPEGRIALPSELAAIVERDAKGTAPDPTRTTAQLGAAGLDYKTVIAAAQSALDRTGSPVKATNLTAHVLVQLSVMEKHFARHAETRPKS